jgi:hypothetical protein
MKRFLIAASLLLLLISCTFPSLGRAVEPTSADAAPAADNPNGQDALTPTVQASPVATSTPCAPGTAIQPASGHPRLWITTADLPRLRSWAVDSNPLYQSLAALAEASRGEMDSGKLRAGDSGGATVVDYPVEMYAELFAFLSLVENDPALQQSDASRAHTLLMQVINAAAKGPQAGAAYRDPEFSVSDRSRWTGEAFALTADWIYPLLTPQDKSEIRTVFLRWVAEDQKAEITDFNHPEPAGVTNDPVLVANRDAVRFALNNYYVAHMRNIGLMSMALDPADDPDGALGAALRSATGSWLYVVDYGLRHDAAGGLAPEGFEYGHQMLSYALQFLLALHTAGQDEPCRWGPQVKLTANPFWDQMVTAYYHSLSPATINLPDVGPVYQPSWYGDSQEYALPDIIAAFGTLGVYDEITGNTARLEALRWWETNTPAGGATALADRVRGASSFTQAILYFLLFDPSAPPAPDPRPQLPLSYLVSGIGKLFARTDWSPQAAWFQFTLGWNRVDHQVANGNHFAFYRNGEWLTKERTGYANIAEGIASSEFENTLALQNSQPPDRDPLDWRYDLWQRGSQWNFIPAGDPQLLATSDTPQYTYALGDSTNLYNSTHESATDILHASRSILWLKPDLIFIYDRAVSKTAGRFKRFWLQLPEPARVSGRNAQVVLPSGQQLFVTSLLPEQASLQAVNTVDQVIQETATSNDPMKDRLKIEATGGPADVRFLTVLQGADPKATPSPLTLVQSSGGIEYEGAAAGNVVVLFPRRIPVDSGAAASTPLVYSAPAQAHLHLVTGLAPGSRFDVSAQAQGDQVTVTLRPGTTYTVDSGGVLAIRLP